MVLIYVESPNGQLKKGALEAVTYGYQVAQALGTKAVALTIGAVNNAGELGKYGASAVYNVASDAGFDSQVYSAIISAAAAQVGADVVVVSHTATGKSLAGRLAVRLGAACLSGVNSLPTVTEGFRVRKSVFSGKAVTEMEAKTQKKVISVMGSTLQPAVVAGDVAVENLDIAVPASRVRVKSVNTVQGITPLPEAELVVSAGRGMKGPENWQIVLDLADVVGATTACSRPVADDHWRPHHEHVGQTGVAIRPKLYIAIGISGAIQHLAGVNQSKCIVVINKDETAPFFKAADYGVVGDLFEIVPRLTEAFRQFKAGQ